MRLLLNFIAIIFLITVYLSGNLALSQAQAQNISFIRDTEIENTIRVYTMPIFITAGLDINAVKINLVNNKKLNAFVANGQKIFINTGLLMQAEYPEEVIGVLSHEIGHITGGHLARFQDGLDSASSQALIAMAIGIPAAILSGRSDIAAAAISLGGHIGKRSILQYTRGMEQAADQAALNFMDKAKISSFGLLKFLSRINQQEQIYSSRENEYTRTHPLTKNRLDFINNHLKTSKYKDIKLPREYTLLHERMRAKLHGYILAPNQFKKIYLPNDVSVAAQYARAINLMRQHKFNDAINIVDILIKNSPNDPFFHELKGDMLRDAGKLKQAIASYEKAIEILPWAALIRISLAHILIEIDQPQYYQQAIDNLNNALRYEPSNLRAWQLLANAYGRTGNLGNAALAQAEFADRRGDKISAVKFAKKAQKILPVGSSGSIKAADIEYQTKLKDSKK